MPLAVNTALGTREVKITPYHWRLFSPRQRLEMQYMPEPNSGCWLWIGAVTDNGYGRIEVSGKATQAHRLSYELHKGPIPENLTIDHLCRVRCCVNPDHLEAVSMRENALRGTGPTAVNAKKTHCIHGHPFSGENLALNLIKGAVRRECRKCRKRHKDNSNRKRAKAGLR